jgi:hypothetical protein
MSKLTEKEKQDARSGCHFYYNGYCMNDIKGRTWCICLQQARDKKGPPSPPETPTV